MKIHRENTYPLPMEQLFNVLTDRAYLECSYAKNGADCEFVECGARDGKFIIDVRRKIQINKGADIPALVRKFVRDEIMLETIMTWEQCSGGVYSGTYRFSAAGIPVDLFGNMYLEPRDEGCVHFMDVNVKCTIPLLGGKISDLVGERVGKILQKDYENTLAYLRDAGLIKA